MRHTNDLFKRTFLSICSFLLIFALGGQTFLLAFGDKANLKKGSKENAEVISSESSIIPAPDLGVFNGLKTSTKNLAPQAGTDQGEESEPNGTIATADALTGTEGKIKGTIRVPGEIDYYSFSATAGDKIYAGVITSFSAVSGSVNSVLEIRDSADTSLETDLDDGTFGPTSSGIAGFTIPSTGTYYFRIRDNGVAATSVIRPYFLYFAVRTAAPGIEVEPNNTPATATPLTTSGRMSGTVNPAADVDFYSFPLAAGDTIFVSLDIDPERDNVQWNGRLGVALFGTTPANQILLANDASVGSATNPLSETFAFTVKDAGIYYAYVDEPAAAGGATFTYTVNVTVIPAPSSIGCTTYTNSTPTPIPDLTLTSSSITVPATTNRIRDINVYINATHSFMGDLDWHLRSPAGNDNGIATDVGNVTTGGLQTSMDWWLDDEAAIPPLVGITASMRHQPENSYRLDWFDGEDPTGTWTLDIRDDATGDTGQLSSWSIEVCEDTPPLGVLIYDQNFEANDGGYTHSGTLDEWEYGTPNTTATNVSPARAAFLTCASGTGCWKTDLDGTYEFNSTMDLSTPNLNLTQYPGPITLTWAMKYQLESSAFDHAFVTVTEVGNPINSRIVWEWNGSTMQDPVGGPTAVNIGESAGWGRYRANITDFAGKIIQVTFHVDGDSSVVYPGMAIDDVQLYHLGPVAANVGVGGRVVDSKGNAISRAYVTLTGANGIPRTARTNTFGYYRFDNVEVGDSYVLQATAKGYTFSPRIVSVSDEIADADIIAIE